MSGCPKCGYLNPEAARFCQSCGAPLPAQQFGQPFSPRPIPSYAEPPRRERTSGEAIVIVAVILLVVLLVGGLASALFYFPFTTIRRTVTVEPRTIIITGLNLQIHYASPYDSYFGPPTQYPGGLTLQLQQGQRFSYSFKLTMGGTGGTSHSIDTVALVTPGFTFITIGPALPFGFSAGSSVTFTMTIQAPNYGFAGPLTIVLSTH